MITNEKLPIEQRLKEKRSPLGFMYISKDTKIPETIEDIHLMPYDKGPVNVAVMKPFRVWKSPVRSNPEKDGGKATLEAFKLLLVESLHTIKRAKGSFALYVEIRQLLWDFEFVGGIYKL